VNKGGRGRRTPAHLKALAGNPGQRPVNTPPELPPGVPAPPEDLPDGARALYEKLAGLLSSVGLLTEADGPALADLALCLHRLRECEAILERVPESMVYGLDGSQTMLEHARRRLARFGGRFRASLIELGDLSWRGRFEGFHAVVSSLAIHHLDDEGKQRLFKDLLAMLSPGGVVIIADLVAPASKRGTALAAEAWDHAVREQSRETGAGEAFAAFERLRWNMYRYPDEDDVDKPSRILDQLKWLEEAGFQRVDVYWMYAGHAIFGGEKPA